MMHSIGYKLVAKKLVKKYPEADLVNLIFHMYLNQELSVAAIGHILKDRYPNTLSWDFDSVKKILTNKIYKGTFENKRLNLENHSPSIVTGEVFQATQQALKSRNRRNRLNHIFGRKCYESSTGENLSLDSSKKKDVQYLYYYSKDTNCRINESIIIEQIEPIFNKYINELVACKLDSLRSTIDRYNTEVDVLDNLLMNDAISASYYSESIEKIHKKGLSKYELIQNVARSSEHWKLFTDAEKNI